MNDKKNEPALNLLLTVVCITYNQEKFIRNALDSFLEQKTNFHFEVIVSDDASTDATPQIIREYENKHGNIIKAIYRENNLGVMKNFLYTLNEARSKYVIYNEGDDYFSDINKLQKQVDFLESHPEHFICFHPVTIKYHDGSKADEIFPQPEFRFNKTEFSLDDLLKYNFMQTNSVMYRWRFIEENILEVFPASSILPLDYYLHLLHAQKGTIGFIDEVMSVYCRHEGGIWWDNQIPEKLLSRYCLETFNFYYEVYKNITNDKDFYYKNNFNWAFNYLFNSMQNYEKFLSIFENYPHVVLDQYIELNRQKNDLTNNIYELNMQNVALTQQNNELTQKIHDIYASKTWKVGMLFKKIFMLFPVPVRKLLKILLRKLRRRMS